jgi:hypothetical protein
MELTPPEKDWVILYRMQDKLDKQYIFAGFKESGNPSYTAKYDKIAKFANSFEAFEVIKQFNDLGSQYVTEVKKICVTQDTYYFI